MMSQDLNCIIMESARMLTDEYELNEIIEVTDIPVRD